MDEDVLTTDIGVYPTVLLFWDQEEDLVCNLAYNSDSILRFNVIATEDLFINLTEIDLVRI